VAFADRARAAVSCSPRSSRAAAPPAQEVIARLRPKLARVRGVSLFLNPVGSQAGGRQTNSTYQYVLKADSPIP
jgi:multidrug efflux pump